MTEIWKKSGEKFGFRLHVFARRVKKERRVNEVQHSHEASYTY